jgi:prepilin-type N-terminal cleavage/methylation domain-containing protein
MEMKRKQTHILNRCSNRGFTMVELLVAMVVGLLAMAGIYSTFLSQHRSYKIQKETSEMQQNIRAAMFYMQREIRMAGSNPYKTLPLAAFGITAPGQNSITFTEDISDGNPGTAPNGSIDANETITYNLADSDADGVVDELRRNGQTVAQNIDWLDFFYINNSVEITIVARTQDPLPIGIIDNNTYWNQQGTASWSAPGDSVSRRLLTTTILCRNL